MTHQAIWVDEHTIAFPSSLAGGTRTAAKLRDFRLGGHPLQVTDLNDEAVERDRRIRSGYVGLKIGASREQVRELLRGPLTITGGTEDTGVQIGPVLDDIYGGHAKDEQVGVHWNEGVPTLSLWAPTARSVALLIDNGGTIPATWDEKTGIWTVVGKPEWKDEDYLWQVEVFTSRTGAVETFEVTDPYSTGLTVDSEKSVLVDLQDPKWQPEDWGANRPEPLRTQAAQTIYELHLRDFSVFDQTVPNELRGTYGAFALEDSAGVRHLQDLADAGVTTIHLLPTYDIASIPERRSEQKIPQIWDVVLDPKNTEALKEIPGYQPSSPMQQAAVEEVANEDAFNWGYDPLHWGAPEGSYALEQNGGLRTLEFRQMVMALHALGFQIVQDVVYNHTMDAGIANNSVFDKIVPGYYHRLDANGNVEHSTCCANIATERQMAEKIMVETLVRWARDYHVDGFRFDLMGHHTLENLIAVQQALPGAYLYGEGWDFGEVAGNRLFTQASQGNIKGTGIGVFNDRIRDAVRGGGPTDEDHRLIQGFGSGQYTDPNAVAGSALQELQKNEALVMLGLAGQLEDFPVPTTAGPILGRNLDYNGQKAGFAAEPQENVNYVEAHDNETLYDSNIFKLPDDADMETRIRMQVLSNATVILSQSPAFLAAGTEILRSKSLDRDSYNSGDWFNGIDWSLETNTFGKGLPVAHKNQAGWALMAPLLENGRLLPKKEDMERAKQMTLELLKIRSTTPQLTLGSATEIIERVSFPAAYDTPGVITMLVTGRSQDGSQRQGDSESPEGNDVLVVFNSTPNVWHGEIPSAKTAGGHGADNQGAGNRGAGNQETTGQKTTGQKTTGQKADGEKANNETWRLHPVQADGVDETVKESSWNDGLFEVPGRTVAVFLSA